MAGTEYAPHAGHVQLDTVLKADGLFVNDAFYGAGSRTYWHRHEHGQLITVTAGEGVVVTRAGDVAVIRKSDVVHCPPGEEHWHGAAPDCFVTYFSVSWQIVGVGTPGPASWYFGSGDPVPARES